MQPMRSEGGCHGVKGPPFYSYGCWVGGFFFKLCWNFGVESGLSTIHFPLGWLAVGFPIFLGLGDGRVVKAKSSQVSDLFPKEFPIVPYFYPICFGKCSPPFIYIGGPKGGRTPYFKIKPSTLGSFNSLSYKTHDASGLYRMVHSFVRQHRKNKVIDLRTSI